VTVSLGWLPLRLPATQRRLWALVAYDPDYRRQIILLAGISAVLAAVATIRYASYHPFGTWVES
jgi:hypothetical protein